MDTLEHIRTVLETRTDRTLIALAGDFNVDFDRDTAMEMRKCEELLSMSKELILLKLPTTIPTS